MVTKRASREDCRRVVWRSGAAAALTGASLLSAGCASPGPPRAPSLQLPAVVNDLQATRRGNAVELQFAVPANATDGQAYRAAEVRATICRAVDAGSCVPVPELTGIALAVPAAQSAGAAAKKPAGRTKGRTASADRVTLVDALAAGLVAGPARLLTYRVDLRNTKGRTAGFGDAAYSVAGATPSEVAGLRAEGSRAGVVVRWRAAPGEPAQGGEVVLRRELVSGPDAAARRPDRKAGAAKQPGGEPGTVWLSTTPAADPLRKDPAPLPRLSRAQGVLDAGAAMDSTYRYAAERQQTVQLGGHTLTAYSGLSAAVEVTLRALYPPPAPTDLVGTVFPVAEGGATEAGGGLAVDLIWTPADDAKTVGYRVSREVLNGSGATVGAKVSLTAQPVRLSAFHDRLPAVLASTAEGRRLRYSVTAVDASGTESTPVTTTVEMKER